MPPLYSGFSDLRAPRLTGLLQRDRQPSAFKRRMLYRMPLYSHLHLPMVRKAFDRNLLGLSSFY